MRGVFAAGFLGLCSVNARAANTLMVPFKSIIAPNAASFFNPSAPMNNAALKVVTSVHAGNYQTWQNVLIDTGSAILWVGGGSQKYVSGPDTQWINHTFSVGYGVGGVNGTAYLDRVTIGEATVNSQIIGAEGSQYGFVLEQPMDGILGLGPSNSNVGEVSGYHVTPTFVENLVSQGTIEEPIFGIYVAPLDKNGGTGEIVFGGIDESRIADNITWVPQNEPVYFHWDFNSSSFAFGDITLDGPIYSRTDTGILGILIPFYTFISILQTPGVSLDEYSALEGTLVFAANLSDSLPDLTFGIADLLFSIAPSQYTVPLSLYSALNITPDDAIHTWIGSGGPDFINYGQKFLENAYSAYDMKNHMVGFAKLA